jgi:hypothetical protein
MHSRIPRSLLESAHCVIVITSVIKGAFGFGGKLWSRGNELPERRGWQGAMDSTVDDGSVLLDEPSHRQRGDPVSVSYEIVMFLSTISLKLMDSFFAQRGILLSGSLVGD